MSKPQSTKPGEPPRGRASAPRRRRGTRPGASQHRLDRGGCHGAGACSPRAGGKALGSAGGSDELNKNLGGPHDRGHAVRDACPGAQSRSPIQSTVSSKSAFDGAVYKGKTVNISPGTPGQPHVSGVSFKGATGFVSMQSVRGRRGAAGRPRSCGFARARPMESLTETPRRRPPYNPRQFSTHRDRFFDLRRQARLARSRQASDDRYGKLAKLKASCSTAARSRRTNSIAEKSEGFSLSRNTPGYAA